MNTQPLFDFLWIGSSTLLSALLIALAILMMKQRVKAWILIGSSGLVAGLLSLVGQGFHVWTLVDPGGVYGIDGSSGMVTIWQSVSIGARFAELLFLIGLLLYALHLGSERRRISELEAILRDRDQAS